MLRHMRTSVEIADQLLEAAKQKARAQHRTLRSLVEEGLRHVLREEEAKPFKLKKHPFGGEGLQPGIDPSDWESIRDISYGLK